MSRWLLVETADDLAACGTTEHVLEVCLEYVPGVVGVVDLGEDCEVVDTLHDLLGRRERVVVWPS